MHGNPRYVKEGNVTPSGTKLRIHRQGQVDAIQEFRDSLGDHIAEVRSANDCETGSEFTRGWIEALEDIHGKLGELVEQIGSV